MHGWGLAGLDDLLICLCAVRLRREPYRYHREWPRRFWQPGKTDEEVGSLIGGVMLNPLRRRSTVVMEGVCSPERCRAETGK